MKGCSVRDEFGNWALFQEMSSCPATMEAGKAADAYGMFEGHDVELADGESAYTQALLGGMPTWVRIPKHQWPQKRLSSKNGVSAALSGLLYFGMHKSRYLSTHCLRNSLMSYLMNLMFLGLPLGFDSPAKTLALGFIASSGF